MSGLHGIGVGFGVGIGFGGLSQYGLFLSGTDQFPISEHVGLIWPFGNLQSFFLLLSQVPCSRSLGFCPV